MVIIWVILSLTVIGTDTKSYDTNTIRSILDAMIDCQIKSVKVQNADLKTCKSVMKNGLYLALNTDNTTILTLHNNLTSQNKTYFQQFKLCQNVLVTNTDSGTLIDSLQNSNISINAGIYKFTLDNFGNVTKLMEFYKTSDTSSSVQTNTIENQTSVWNRRSNLHQININAISSVWSPFITKIEVSNETKIQGFYYDVWQVLQTRLNFTTTITKSSVTSGTWASMMTSVQNQEYDLILSGSSLTASRAETMDFSFAIVQSTLRMVHLRDSESFNWSLYINSFQYISWAGILSSLLSLFILVSSMIYFGKYLKNTVFDFGAQNLAAFLYLSHLGRRFAQEPQDLSLRTAFLSISLCGFMIFTLYKSMISASLAIKVYKPPVDTLEEILNTPYNLIITNGTSIHEMFKTENSLYHKIFNSGKLIVTKNNGEIELKRMIEERSTDLFFGVYQPLKILPEYPCLITSIPLDYRKLGNGLIFQKHWVYKELINFHLFKMYEEGIIDSLAKKWIRKESEASCAAIVSTCGSS